MHMPSRPSKAGTACLLVAAAGLGIAALDKAQPDSATRTLGLAALALGVISLANDMMVKRATAEIDAHRAIQTEAGRREIDAYRATIEGEAFAQALHLIRSGELTTPRPTDEATIHTLHPRAPDAASEAPWRSVTEGRRRRYDL